MKLKDNPKFETNSKGFTLIEILVAILVGGTVLTIAIIALVATNSTSLKVLARADVQQNTRQALSVVFTEVSDAESLPKCRLIDPEAASSQEKQAGLFTPGSNYPENPTPPAYRPFILSECIETSSSGHVVAYASNNRLCYFKTPEGPARQNPDTRPSIKCITRGGPHAGNVVALLPAIPAVTNCVGRDLSTFSPRNIYTYECAGTGGLGLVIWPNAYAIVGAPVLIAELGTLPSTAVEGPSFTYLPAGSVTSTKDILGVRIEMLAGYDSKIAVAGDPNRTYPFSQTILLRGSEQFQEENANG